MGIFMAFQYPVEIPGIANSSFLRTAINSIRKKIILNLLTQEFFRRIKPDCQQIWA